MSDPLPWWFALPASALLGATAGLLLTGPRLPRRRRAVTALTAVAFTLPGGMVALGSSPLALLPALLYWAAISVLLILIDLDDHRLPNAIVLPAYPVTAALLVFASVLTGAYARLGSAAIGCLVLFACYGVLAAASPGGMGLGDVKLAGALGMLLGWFGWAPLIVGGFSAFLLGGVVSLALMLARRATRTSRIPFGPFMIVGAWIGMLAGSRIAGVAAGGA